MLYNMNGLQKCATEACQIAVERRSEFTDAAVNWADFKCTDVRHWSNIDGISGYSVYIEEADPSPSRDLEEFIREHLKSNNFPDVEVIFDW